MLKQNKQLFQFAIFFSILVILLIVLVFLFPNKTNFNSLPENYVTEVIDGDTFEMYSSSGDIETIRLLCIDTPEKNQEGYEEAKSYLESLILNKQVILNSSITDKDAYNRLLRYIYVNDSGNLLFINKLILGNNYGELLIIPPEECKLLFLE